MFRPLHNYCLVRPDAQALSNTLIVVHERQRNEGGITGTIVAMGPGKWEAKAFVPTQGKVGDRVMLQDVIEYRKFDGCLVAQDADICCVIEPDRDILQKCNKEMSRHAEIHRQWLSKDA